ncbi:MAG: hypothetical protein KatS3mg008_0159 [Acidimicrobiales bacterium]|nr:MAG: hypothetical protein KatS3mg008_0159 [Acidimicrobiales bacterium]
MRRSLILDTTVRWITDGALVFSFYLLVAGHNRTGGGFVAGLVAASTLALGYMARGRTASWLERIRPWFVLAAGIGLAAGVAAVSALVADHVPLDQRSWDAVVPLFGAVKITSALVFDTGVFLVVLGLTGMILEGLGEAQRHGEAEI